MADEIHMTREADGTTHTTTVVEREPRRGGGITLIVIVALAVAAFLGFQFLGNEKAETGNLDAVTSLSYLTGSSRNL